MNQKQDKSAEIISQGIESLIEQLKQKGVNAGKEEAEQIIKAAQTKANEILNNAQQKTKTLMEDAQQKILQEKKAVEDALGLAARNIRLELRQNLIDRFSQEVQRIVHKELDNEDMLRQLILMVASDSAEQLQAFKSQKFEILLPQKVLDFDEIRQNPDLMNKDPLKELIQSLTHAMLKEGMSVIINPDARKPAGIKVHLVEENIVLDLSEDAVSALLINHMQPRFRALLEGLL